MTNDVIILRKFHCKRCGEDFHSRSRKPEKCGRRACRSPYWNRDRKIKKAS